MADEINGITRICEGKATYTSSGKTDLHATEGNLTTCAATTNNVHSGEGGINHLDYEPLHPHDTMDTTVDITLNLFFDGTNNNRSNTKAREEKKDSYKANAFENGKTIDDNSYDNGYTNVVHGFDATIATLPKQAVVYIEGIGTRNEGEDEITFGKGLATGKTGYNVKVEKGCDEAAKEVKAKKDQAGAKQINVLTVNLFGFSRGAATARYFLHLATQRLTFLTDKSILSPTAVSKPITKRQDIFEKHGYFSYCLDKYQAIPNKIVFNFVGLYDTVSSYGAYHGENVEVLGLNSIKKAEMTFQIAADDEFRENFDLTNINSAGLKGLEITLPGVHSDIGGSYRNYTEGIDPEKRTHYTANYRHNSNEPETYYHNEALAIKKMLVEEGWYTKDQLWIEVKKTIGVWYKLKLVGERNLLNTYDRIALTYMTHLTKKNGVKMDGPKVSKMTEISDTFIINVHNQLKTYINQCFYSRTEYINKANNNPDLEAKLTKKYLENAKHLTTLRDENISLSDLRDLRNRFLHWSVNNDKFGLGPRTNMLGYAGDLKKQSLRKREIQDG